MGVTHIEPGPDAEPELREKMIEIINGDGAQKPWDVVASVSDSSDVTERDAKDALKELMLEGRVEIAAEGEVRTTAAPA
ncbi:hypothetical protein [Haloarcula sp. H-GB5]